MINNKRKCCLLLVIFLVLGATGSGCGGAPSSMPNPAAEKCIQDGFELEPVMVDGVPREYRCVDPRTGNSCEVWQYYRNECRMAASSMPNPAAEKCVRDGYDLKAIVVDGVPRGYECVDPRTGKSCEVWKYFRNECTLSSE